MTKIILVGCVLIVIGIAGLAAYSREKGDDYLSPSEAGPKGKAPKMEIQVNILERVLTGASTA
jgi:hypothetical protein